MLLMLVKLSVLLEPENENMLMRLRLLHQKVSAKSGNMLWASIIEYIGIKEKY